jgi:hypothetical protein
MKLAVVCLSLLFAPQMVFADTLVTWRADGELNFSRSTNPFISMPPVGTPYSLTMTLDPSSQVRYFGGAAGMTCYSVGVSGLLTLGGFDYNLAGTGYTHALIEQPCWPTSNEAIFRMGVSPVAPGASPWSGMERVNLMELWFTDPVQHDLFRDTPFPGGFQIRDEGFSVHATHNLHQVLPEQMSPVPEPGTLSLFALGLAALRARRA